MLKLGIPIRVLGTLASLAVRLKAETGRFQQLSHLRVTHPKAIRLQRTRQGSSALAGPSQRGLGAPRESGSTSLSRAATNPGCSSVRDFRPLPCRRWRSGRSGLGSLSSLIPLRIVRSEIPVAAATAVIPPLPRESASLAAQRRRPRSSRSWAMLTNFCRIHSMTRASGMRGS